MSIYNYMNVELSEAYNIDGDSLEIAYDVNGNIVFQHDQQELPILSGNLNASDRIILPNLYDPSEGFTCTGLSYDPIHNCFLVGDTGTLSAYGTFRPQIVKVSTDFETVVGTIPLYNLYPNMVTVQGITFDTRDSTLWICSTEENKVRHITQAGENISNFTISQPTGIAFDKRDYTLWILTISNKILHVTTNGVELQSYDFNYTETLDQCFLDTQHGYLYITAGTNYTSRNNIYRFDTETHDQAIACTVDSYAVEGLYLEPDRLIIVNDGYYHQAVYQHNTADIYDLT